MSEERTEVMAVAARPQRLSELVGGKRIAAAIQKFGEKPRAWMFVGPPGTGKTTLARIVAVSLQYDEGEFGEPSDEVLANKDIYDILEVNAAHFRGVEDIQNIVEISHYAPRPPSKKRVVILDEAQQMSRTAQNLLLKPFEDGSESTTWIICTTDPQKVIAPLRDRCTTFKLSGLSSVGMKKLIKRIGGQLEIQQGLSELCEGLVEAGVRSPRQVIQSVEKLAASGDVASAIQQSIASDVPPEAFKMARAITSGRWNDIRKDFKTLHSDNVDPILRTLVGYLRSMVAGGNMLDRNTQVAAYGIDKVVRMQSLGDYEKLSAFTGLAVELCVRFSGKKWIV